MENHDTAQNAALNSNIELGVSNTELTDEKMKAEATGHDLPYLPGAVPELTFTSLGKLGTVPEFHMHKSESRDSQEMLTAIKIEGSGADGVRAEAKIGVAESQDTELANCGELLEPQPSGVASSDFTEIGDQMTHSLDLFEWRLSEAPTRIPSDGPTRAPSNAILQQHSYVREDNLLYIHFSGATWEETCKRTEGAVSAIHDRVSRQWNLKLPVSWLRRLRATQVVDWSKDWFQTIEVEDKTQAKGNILITTLSLPEEKRYRFCAGYTGVPNSLLFVPVFSVYADGSGSLETLVQWPNSPHQDCVNPMLLELAIAKELLCAGEGLIKGIEPVLILESNSADLKSMLDRLSDEPHEPTNNKAVMLLLQWGHSFVSGETRRVKSRTVRELVEFCIVRRQAVSLSTASKPPALEHRPSKDNMTEEAVLLERQLQLAVGWPLSGEDEQAISDRLKHRTHELIALCKIPIIDEVRHHTPFASEFYRFLDEQGMGEMIDMLAMEGVFSFQDFLEFSEKVLAENNPKAKTANASFLRRYSAIGDMGQADSVKILSLYKDVVGNSYGLGKSLKERMYKFDDHESDPWAALFSSNCIETGLSSWPTRMLLLLFGILYIGFGLMHLQVLFTEERYVEQPDVFVPAEPKVLKGTRVLNVVISFMMSIFLIATVAVAKVHCVLAASRVLIAAIAVFTLTGLIGAIMDMYQCSVDGDGIGKACSGVSGFAQMTTTAMLLVTILFFQRWTWILALVSQGGYLFYIAWRYEPKSIMMRLIYSAVGLAFMTTAALIYIKHQVVLRSARTKVEDGTTEFQLMWKTLMESHKPELDELAKQAEDIRSAIGKSVSQQRARGKASPYTRNGKSKQQEKDIDELFKQAGEISAPFQKWVAGWSQSGRVQPGCVKNPNRAIQKVVRSYGRDSSCLTDLVRCTIVVNDVSQILSCLNQILGKAEVCFHWDAETSLAVDETKIMSITSIKNRFDPEFNAAEQSLHYRDLLLNVEVGYVFSNGHVRFLPLCKWGSVEGLQMKRHICEIQILIYNFHSAKKDLHRHYVHFRNIRVQ